MKESTGWLILLLWVVMCWGSPDLIDNINSYVKSQSKVCPTTETNMIEESE